LRDIERFVEGDAIQAKGDSVFLAAKKWVMKNKLLTCTLLLSFITVTTFVTLMNSLYEERKKWRSKEKRIISEYKEIKDELEEKTSLASSLENRKNIWKTEKNSLLEQAKTRKNQLETLKTSLSSSQKNVRLLSNNLQKQQQELQQLKEKAKLVNENSYKGFKQKALDAYRGRQFEDAKKFLLKAVRLNKVKMEHDDYNLYSVILWDLGEKKAAYKSITKAIALDSNNETYWLNRGVFYAEDKKYDKALRDFHQSLKLNPAQYQSLFFRGSVYIQQKEYKKALADFTLCRKIKPDFGKVKVDSFINLAKSKLK
jgi:tetratricopeptide (TPR) repeat protein